MTRTDARSTVIVMFSLALAVLTGFFRQTAIASILGAGRTTDIYLVAFAIPEFVFIALPIILTPVIIPLFSKIRQEYGERSAWHWGLRLSGWILLMVLLIAIIAALVAPIFISWISPGFSAAEKAQTIQVFYRMLPGLIMMGLSALTGSFLQVYRRFARPVLTTAVYNLVFISSLLFLPLYDPLMRAAWGVTLGATAAMLFQVPLLLQLRPREKVTAEGLFIDQKTIGGALRLTSWMAAGYGANQFILFFDRALATTIGAGSVAILNYGYHISLSIVQLSGLAISIVLFPGLSENVGFRNMDQVRRSINHAMVWIWGLAFPATLGLILLRTPIVRVLLEHGAFQVEATQAVSSVLAIYSLAALADALCQPLWRAVYALHNGKAVLAINSIQTIVRVAADLILIQRFGYNGIAFSATLGLSFQLLILVFFINKRMNWKLTRHFLVVFGKITVAGLVTSLVTLAIKTWIGNSFPNLAPIEILLILGSLLLVAYVLLVGRTIIFFE
jgi:putative peptidoglycan lipid II flippase